LKSGWAAQFGTAPAVTGHQPSPEQCAALALAQQFHGSAGGKLELGLDAARATRRAEITGAVHDTAGRAVWLAIVTPGGQVFPLTERLQDAIGAERKFRFQVRSGAPGQYVLVAVSSEKALVRTGAMKPGTQAAALFELVGRELAKDGRGAVDIGVVELLP
jgi:hypothetical protein